MAPMPYQSINNSLLKSTKLIPTVLSSIGNVVDITVHKSSPKVQEICSNLLKK